MLFDDVPLNIESAEKIGMHGILINSENPLSGALKPFLKNITRREKNYE
jgi:FMN phosphatase YigB (HAD superfamily)